MTTAVIRVIARNSSFYYKGKSPKALDVGRELGVAYVVRYYRDLEDIFAVQDDLTRTVVSTIAGRIEAVGHGRASRMSADSLQAHNLVLRARHHTYAFTRPDNAEAQKLLAGAPIASPVNRRDHDIVRALDPGHQSRDAFDGTWR